MNTNHTKMLKELPGIFMNSNHNLIKCECFQKFESEQDISYWQTIRKYFCESCSSKFVEINKKIEGSYSGPCPECNNELSIIIDGVPSFSIDDIKTIGQQADRNLNRSRYKRSEIEEANKPREKRKEEAAKIAKLANATPEQKNRYINEGKI